MCEMLVSRARSKNNAILFKVKILRAIHTYILAYRDHVYTALHTYKLTQKCKITHTNKINGIDFPKNILLKRKSILGVGNK